MRIKTAILNTCLALLIPMSAIAQKPEPGTCGITVPPVVMRGHPFNVQVQPGTGDGPWRQPTVLVEITVPLEEPGNSGIPNTYSQSVTMTFDETVKPNNTPATFVIATDNFLGNVDPDGEVQVFATVSEPVNRGRSIESYCEAVTGFTLPPTL